MARADPVSRGSLSWHSLSGDSCACTVFVPGVYYSDLIWNRRIRPLFRDVRKKRQDIDSQTTEVFGGMRVVRAFGRQKVSRRGSWVKATSWSASSSTLVAFAIDRALVGICLAHGLGRPLTLRRHGGHRRPALAGRPDDCF